jgi:hypothetical protein
LAYKNYLHLQLQLPPNDCSPISDTNNEPLAPVPAILVSTGAIAALAERVGGDAVELVDAAKKERKNQHISPDAEERGIEGGKDLLVTRNPLLRVAVSPDSDGDFAVFGFAAVGCFEAGDNL